MSSRSLSKSRLPVLQLLVVGAAILAATPAFGQSGHVLDGVGPFDQSLGGATTALPLDAIGATHRNPASMVGLAGSEVAFSMAVFASDTDMTSRVDQNAFGPGVPPATMQGSTPSNIDMTPMPAMGMVHHAEDSSWAYGIGAYGVGGFGVDFAGSSVTSPSANPVLTPQPPGGFGFGAVYSEFQMMQIVTPLACKLTDRLSVGFGPTFNWASLAVTPFAAAPPVGGMYLDGTRSDARWGLGLQAGIFWQDPCSGWNVGVNFNSTTWLNAFNINTMDPNGNPQVLHFNLDYPAIYSLGVAYTGFERFDLSADVRYIDYEHTDGFHAAKFDPATGAVTGFGWNSIWVAAIGFQYEVCPTFHFRMGYTYNDSPINSGNIFYNVPAPGIVQHHANIGFSWDTPHEWVLAVAYHHGFENSVDGPWQGVNPQNGQTVPLPGTAVRADLRTDTIVASVAKRF